MKRVFHASSANFTGRFGKGAWKESTDAEKPLSKYSAFTFWITYCILLLWWFLNWQHLATKTTHDGTWMHQDPKLGMQTSILKIAFNILLSTRFSLQKPNMFHWHKQFISGQLSCSFKLFTHLFGGKVRFSKPKPPPRHKNPHAWLFKKLGSKRFSSS